MAELENNFRPSSAGQAGENQADLVSLVLGNLTLLLRSESAGERSEVEFSKNVKAKPQKMFREGEDVLMRAPDGLLYLGVLVEIDEDEVEQPALVRFGDGSEKRANFGDLRRIGLESGPSTPVLPSSTSSRPATPPPPVLTPFDHHLDLPYHVSNARKELPYDFDSLIWDTNHERNIEEKYCYCGESGLW